MYCTVSTSSRGGTDRSNGRAGRGLPVACYESCQSPECNRYQGPEVGIEPIRSAPPRACRRPGRFIMLISPRQGSTRAPRAFRSRESPPPLPHPAFRSFPSLFLFTSSRSLHRECKAGESAASRAMGSRGKLGYLVKWISLFCIPACNCRLRPNDYLHLARKRRITADSV